MGNKIKKIFIAILMSLILVSTFTNTNVYATSENNTEETQVNQQTEDKFMDSKDLLEMVENNDVSGVDYSYPDKPYIVGQDEDGNLIRSSLEKEEFKSFLKGNLLRSSGNSSGMLCWEMYCTPKIWIDGWGDVYCGNPTKNWPSGGTGYGSVNPLSDNRITIAFTYGYPVLYDGAWGNSNDDAYVKTFAVFNGVIGNYNVNTMKSFGDGWVNMIYDKVDAGIVPQQTFNISVDASTETMYNPAKNQIESKVIPTSGSSGQFTVKNLPTGFYVTDKLGNQVSQLNIGDSFKIATKDLTYTGTIKFNIETTHKKRAAAKWEPYDSSYQTLYSFYRYDPIPVKEQSITFDAVTSKLIIQKTDKKTGELINATFEVWNADKTELLETLETVDGVAETDLTALDTYWVKEIAVEEPYVINPLNEWQEVEITEFGLEYNVDFANAIGITVKAVKIDSYTGQIISTEDFELQLKNKETGEILPVTKVEAGVHYWENVETLQVYELSEVKAPVGYILSSEIKEINLNGDYPDLLYTIEYMNAPVQDDLLVSTGQQIFEGTLIGVVVMLFATSLIIFVRKK